MDFKNKVVVVTGGASGIGKAICLAFVEAGAKVICIDLAIDNDAAVDLFLSEVSADKRHMMHFLDADVSGWAECGRLWRFLKNDGRIDVLVNNAAIQPLESYVPLHLLPVYVWDRMLEVNLKGYFLMAKYCIPFMLEQGGGVIINIASVTGLAAAKCISAYAASKAAIISLTRSIALEYGDKNIRSVAICPWAIDTPLLRKTLSAQTHGLDVRDAKEKMDSAHPIGRIGTPEEIAATVLFCAGPGASFMTGSAVTVDGGLMAKGAWAIE